MDKPFAPTELSANLARDWPDARGIWLSEDKKLAAYVNRKDHALLLSVVDNGDFKSAFEKFAEFIKNV